MHAIEVEHLQKRYGDRLAVEDVSFAVHEGEVFGILGPNGAGKTTTVECILGLRTPDGGRLRVLGRDPRDPELRGLVGAQLQEAELPERLRAGEALELLASLYDEPADLDELVAMLDLGPFLGTRFGRLSGGQQQRLSIALALVGSPRIAVLDELTTGLDPQARRDTWALVERVRARGVTIVLVTHAMEEAERLCDRVAVLDRGRVVALDAPGALADRAGGEQRIRFRPRPGLDPALLRALPEVADVGEAAGGLVVTGGPDALAAVTSLLAREGVLAEGLRVEQAGLEDAYLSLTHRDALEPR
jgi:ABC-2 type transport system ATP-binding protein